MAIPPEIAATISEMSKPKAEDRPFAARAAKPLGPTPERMAKPDYFGARDSRKKVRALLSLRESGELSSESETVAERWIDDYQYANFGYADFMREPVPDDYVKGDAITFGLNRAHGGHRIALIRDSLGADTHHFLVRLLIAEHSFSEMARDLVPHIKGTPGGKAIRQRAVMLLKLLPSIYRAAVAEQKRLAEAVRN
ncbi:hypothetical protein [Asaia bogorensis]|uniref:hypothetical protein n=1 Tax=Asaia bogorensis TaxID=91915 RepID=UPI0028563F47|nr:hypothetical protein [Asaia bogorensis]MDR6182026.1 hypothetical protein [Asaia bogorensis NBRC 16594]